MINPRVKVDQETLSEFCRRYGVARLSLFGSVLREDFRPDSDIDVLIEFPPGKMPDLMELGGMQMELTELMGRDVDLKTPGFLSRYFRDDVLRSAQAQYVAPIC